MQKTKDVEKEKLSDNQLEALKLLQPIIERMGENSRRTKTYFFTLTGILGAILSRVQIIDYNLSVLLLIYLLLAINLWHQDAKYLVLEKQFRKHHNAIINNNELTYKEQFDCNPNKYKKDNVFYIMCTNFSLIIYWIFIIPIIIGIFYLF